MSNNEHPISNDEVAVLLCSFQRAEHGRAKNFDIHYSLFDIHYSNKKAFPKWKGLKLYRQKITKFSRINVTLSTFQPHTYTNSFVMQGKYRVPFTMPIYSMIYTLQGPYTSGSNSLVFVHFFMCKRLILAKIVLFLILYASNFHIFAVTFHHSTKINHQK